MAFLFFFPMALSFTSRPTRVPSLGRFILPRGQRGSLPSGALFYLAANEDSLVIGRQLNSMNVRCQEGSLALFFFFTSRPTRNFSLGRFLLPRGQRGSLFFSRALYFTSRPTRNGFFFLLLWRLFFFPRGQRVCRALSFTSRPTRNFLSRALSFTSRPTRNFL